MRMMLLAAAASLAALAIPAAPAQAQSWSGATVSQSGPFGHGDFRGWHRDGDRDQHDRRRHRRHRDTVVVGDFGWNDGWALYNNRSFEPDSYNDWWHERPWRSYPRWVRSNRDCTPDRMWWGGGVWRCSW